MMRKARSFASEPEHTAYVTCPSSTNEERQLITLLLTCWTHETWAHLQRVRHAGCQRLRMRDEVAVQVARVSVQDRHLLGNCRCHLRTSNASLSGLVSANALAADCQGSYLLLCAILTLRHVQLQDATEHRSAGSHSSRTCRAENGACTCGWQWPTCATLLTQSRYLFP